MITTEQPLFVDFDTLYRQSITDLGFRNADSDARNIIRALGLPFEELPTIRRTFLRAPDAYLYPGVSTTLRDFLTRGDSITIWTEGETKGDETSHIPGFKGQLQKIARSGLRRQLINDNTLTSNDRHTRFSVSSVEQKKTRVLPELLDDAYEKGSRHIFILDDKSKNVYKAQAILNQALTEGRQTGRYTDDIEIHAVWIRQGRTKDILPENYTGTLDDFKREFKTVTSISEYAELIRTYRSENRPTSIAHFLDWDHTLADETGRKLEIKSLLEQQYANHPELGKVAYLESDDPRHSAITRLICTELSIPESAFDHVKTRFLIEPLVPGASFVGLFRVAYGDHDFVVKHEQNPQKQWRVSEEIDGYEKLARMDGYIHQKLPKVHHTTNDEVLGLTIIMENFNGPNLRFAVRDNLLSHTELITALSNIYQINYDFWTSQEPLVSPKQWFSMQRSEFPDTVASLQKLLPQIAETIGITTDELWNTPIRVHKGDKVHELPLEVQSFEHIVQTIEQFLETPPYKILPILHNDLSHANIVVLPNHEVRIIDPQWVREGSDPAGDLTRLIKSVSSTTVHVTPNHIEYFSTSSDSSYILFDAAADIPESALKMETYGTEQIKRFAQAIDDPTLEYRTYMHLAASHLREIALIAKGRGTPAQIGFNVYLLSHYFEKAQNCSHV